jgi:hypothetical protein
MPDSILSTDIGFPKQLPGEAAEVVQGKILNYLFLLKEQLSYSMYNLSLQNFNTTAFKEISGIIREPLEIRLETDEGLISQLRVDLDGINLTVSNGTDTSTIALRIGEIEISSQVIEFSGMVTFMDLETTGSTTINGDNITTGTITAITLNSCVQNMMVRADSTISGEMNFYYYVATEGTKGGGIQINDQGAGTPEDSMFRIIYYTENGVSMKLVSAANLSMTAAGIIYMQSMTSKIFLDGSEVWIRNAAIYTADMTGVFNFLPGGIYYNGFLIAPYIPPSP